MNCKKEFSTNFLYENMTTNWLNGVYKEHRSKVLIEKEKSMIPATQESLIGWRKVQQLRKENTDRERKIEELTKEIHKTRADIHATERETAHMSANRYMGRRGDDGEASSSSEEVSKWTMPCPADECDGFLNRSYVWYL
jgi:hypothetical protein